MSRSAHTFLPKNKLVAGMGIGAIAMLAMAGPALTDDNEHENASKKDEVFEVHSTGTASAGRGQYVLFV